MFCFFWTAGRCKQVTALVLPVLSKCSQATYQGEFWHWGQRRSDRGKAPSFQIRGWWQDLISSGCKGEDFKTLKIMRILWDRTNAYKMKMLMEALKLLERQQNVTVQTCLCWLTWKQLHRYIANEEIETGSGGKSQREMWSAELKVL